jgi:ABC-type antimicrobial peptide transport system permease subunit
VFVGLLLAAGAMCLIQRLSYGFGAGEILVLATAAGVVLMAAAAASYLPALRATRADPVAALHAE